ITVAPVVETPTLTASDVSVNENQSATVLSSLPSLPTRRSSDLADQSDTITVHLSVAHGTLTLGTSSGTSLSFTGTQTAVDASLALVTYTPNFQFQTSDTLTFSATTSDTATGLPTSTATSSTTVT